MKTRQIAHDLAAALQLVRQLDSRPFTPESPRYADKALRTAVDRATALCDQLGKALRDEFPHSEA